MRPLSQQFRYILIGVLAWPWIIEWLQIQHHPWHAWLLLIPCLALYRIKKLPALIGIGCIISNFWMTQGLPKNTSPRPPTKTILSGIITNTTQHTTTTSVNLENTIAYLPHTTKVDIGDYIELEGKPIRPETKQMRNYLERYNIFYVLQNPRIIKKKPP